nr:MAG TPA: major tail protein [Caudoviricetes sp.]
MSQRVSTAGMSLQYCVETTAGTRPTTGYKVIPEIKSMPSFNPAPNTIDSTTLAETEYMTYVAGLKDLGGALEYGANLTDDLVTFWEELLEAYDTAAAAGKAMWFAVVHPKLAKATFYTGTPSPIGINDAAVGNMAETTLYITPTGAPVMEAKPTASV